MGQFSLAKLFGMTIRESATDGSDFTNPDVDYRRLFLGEDGILHLKDSAGAVTDIGGSTYGTPGLTLGTANSAGTATAAIRTDAGIAIFDATVPVTQAFGDAAAAGSATVAARRDHKHGMPADPGGGGTDVVNVASGAGSVTIPGLKGSPDAVPGSPGTGDDEFDTTSSFSSTLGSLDANNTTDFPSNLHLQKNATGTYTVSGVYKARSTLPYTVTAKMSDFKGWAATAQAGLMVAEASPGKLFCYGFTFTGGGIMYVTQWTNNTSRASATAQSGFVTVQYPAPYIRLVVTSSSSISCYVSFNGYIWTLTHNAVNEAFTPGAVGLFVTGNDGNIAVEAVFDWVRFS